MPGMEAKDGTILQFPKGTPVELMDAATQGYEQSGQLPSGVTKGGPGAIAQLRDYLTQATANQIQPYQETLSQLEQKQGMPQLGGTQGTPREQALATARQQIPQTPTEALGAAAGAASGAMPGVASYGQALKQMLARVAMQGGAGATGAVLEGQNPVGGAAKQTVLNPGVIADVGLSTVPGAVGALANRMGRRAATIPNVGLTAQAINEATPPIIDPRTGAALNEPLASGVKTGPELLEWVQKYGVDKAGELYKKGQDAVIDIVKRAGEVIPGTPDSIASFQGRGPGGRFNTKPYSQIVPGTPATIITDVSIPILGAKPVPLSYAMEEAKKLGDIAYSATGELPKNFIERGYDKRTAYATITEQISEAIGERSQPALQLYEAIKDHYATVRGISETLKRGGSQAEVNAIFPPSRSPQGVMFDLQPVQESLPSLIGPLLTKGLKSFATALTRGGEIGSTDVRFGLSGGRYNLPGSGVGVYLPRVGVATYGGLGNPVPTQMYMQPYTGAQVEVAGSLLKKMRQDYGLEGE